MFYDVVTDEASYIVFERFKIKELILNAPGACSTMPSTREQTQ
jgi:hypothetical protein